jgi:hypothetical protein
MKNFLIALPIFLPHEGKICAPVRKIFFSNYATKIVFP